MKKAVSKKCTIYDVAAKAGASSATVSRVIANSGYPVSGELRNRILDAAKELNYTPNAVGRMLKKSESTDIGIIIPTITNPYYSALLLGAEQEARKEGYNLFLCNSLRDAATERKYLDSLFQKQVRGIMVPSAGDNPAKLKDLQQYGVCIVAFDQGVDDAKCNSVGFDYARGARLAMDHLVENGHSKIAFLSAPVMKKSRQSMLEGYRHALADHGLPAISEYVVLSESEEELQDGTYEFQNGRRLAGKFLTLADRPTAILAINDLTAAGIMQELAANGVCVPQDVSIVGFDNIELSAMLSPPLTTVNQPAFETGRLACRMLLDSLAGSRDEGMSVLLQPQLVVRNSVAQIS